MTEEDIEENVAAAFACIAILIICILIGVH